MVNEKQQQLPAGNLNSFSFLCFCSVQSIPITLFSFLLYHKCINQPQTLYYTEMNCGMRSESYARRRRSFHKAVHTHATARASRLAFLSFSLSLSPSSGIFMAPSPLRRLDLFPGSYPPSPPERPFLLYFPKRTSPFLRVKNAETRDTHSTW